MKDMIKCARCEETKPLALFTPDARHKSGYKIHCKKCTATTARQRYWKHKPKTRNISDNDRTFFELGVLKGEERVHDLEKALSIMERANRALLEVVKEADLRDLKQSMAG